MTGEQPRLKIGSDVQPITVTLLSDDANLSAMLSHMLALSSEPVFSCRVMSSSQFSEALALQSHVIFIDRIYRNASFYSTIESLAAHTAINALPRIVLLLDEASLAADLGSLAQAARLGVESFMLKSELSLKQILQYLNGTQPNITPNSAANLALPATAPQSSSTALQTAPTSEAVSAPPHQHSTNEQRHQLTVDIQNQRVHVSEIAESGVFNNSMLEMQQWLALLDSQGAADFKSLLEKATNYQPIPASISCKLLAQNGDILDTTITEIQLKNDGQGRVVGASAQLLAFNPQNDIPDTVSPRSGFDNLGDSLEIIASDDIWKQIAVSLPMLCLLLDEQGKIAKIINSDLTMHDLPPLESGQTLAELLHIETLDNLAEAIIRTLNTGKPHQQTVAYTGPAGMRWLDTHITPLKGDAGLSRQVLWTAFDITATRHAYQELLKNHDALADMLDDAPVLFFQKDGSGRYLRTNRAFCDFFDLRTDVIAGRSDKEIFDPETLANFQKITANNDSQSGNSDYSFTLTQHQKEYQLYWKTTAITSATGGNIESTIGFGFAIDTSLEALPNQENTQSDNVAQLADTHPENSELVLSGAIGQDFKTMLTSIVSYTEMAMSQKNAGREARFINYIDQVLNTANHARTLLSDCATDNSDDTIEAIELKPLITDVVETLRPTLPSQLDFQVDIDNDTQRAMVCGKKFRKIVMQLLASARDNANATINEKSADQSSQQIQLSLSNAKPHDSQCAGCDASLDGDYIALTVRTPTGALTDKNYQTLIKAAKTATTRNTADNVIAMTHSSDGHALIHYADQTLSLQMLFPQA
jgi:PAS domain-containing protein